MQWDEAHMRLSNLNKRNFRIVIVTLPFRRKRQKSATKKPTVPNWDLKEYCLSRGGFIIRRMKDALQKWYWAIMLSSWLPYAARCVLCFSVKHFSCCVFPRERVERRCIHDIKLDYWEGGWPEVFAASAGWVGGGARDGVTCAHDGRWEEREREWAWWYWYKKKNISKILCHWYDYRLNQYKIPFLTYNV